MSIGLISFAAVAQFAPVVIGGCTGAAAPGEGRARRSARRLRGVGLYAAAALVRQVGLAADPTSSSTACFGLEWLRPGALRPQGPGPIAHSLFWNLLANMGPTSRFLMLRVPTGPGRPGALFVDVFGPAGGRELLAHRRRRLASCVPLSALHPGGTESVVTRRCALARRGVELKGRPTLVYILPRPCSPGRSAAPRRG